MKIFGLRIIMEEMYQYELKRHRNGGYLEGVQAHAEQVATLMMEKQILEDKIDTMKPERNCADRFFF